MLTPQEVASHAFAKATFGGYNMAMVDEFLDTLTEDYTALYNDNAILKNKLKVLSDSVEEYRATDVAMRKTLLAAQQMAESMVAEAEQKKGALVKDAEAAAESRINELKKQVEAEEFRLKAAQEATAGYVAKLRQALSAEQSFLNSLSELVPAGTGENVAAVEEIRAAVANLAAEPKVEVEEEAPVEEAPAEAEVESEPMELDPDVTRRFEDLKFSKDYTIE